MLGAMAGDAKVQAFGADGLGEGGDDVLLRAHLGRVPMGVVRVIHGESVVMLGDGHDVTGAGILEEFRPRHGVEVLGLEHRDEILVAEFRRRAVGVAMVLINPATAFLRLIHFAGIPFVAESGNRIHAPVDEDAELGVLIPGGDFVFGEGGPFGFKGTGVGDLANLGQLHRDGGIGVG